jgi:cell division protein FtsB
MRGKYGKTERKQFFFEKKNYFLSLTQRDSLTPMRIIRAAKRFAIAMVAPTLFMSLTAYFVWNASRGEHGLRNYAVRRAQLVVAEQTLAAAQAEHDQWEVRVAGLRDAQIDPDTLDERARAKAEVADPADLVVPSGPGKKLY